MAFLLQRACGGFAALCGGFLAGAGVAALLAARLHVMFRLLARGRRQPSPPATGRCPGGLERAPDR